MSSFTLFFGIIVNLFHYFLKKCFVNKSQTISTFCTIPTFQYMVCFRSRQKDISSPVGQLLQKSLQLGDDEQQVPQVSSLKFVYSYYHFDKKRQVSSEIFVFS
jgi:hypothetical protein